MESSFYERDTVNGEIKQIVRRFIPNQLHEPKNCEQM